MAQKGDWWGTQSEKTVLPSDLHPGDPQYNERQKEFESTVNWQHIEDSLKAEAEKRGVTYDRSDLAGIQRNAGYDQAHLGDAGLYNSQLQRYYENALGNYDQRANNTTHEGSNDGGGGSSVAQQWNSSEGGGRADDFYAQLLARSQQSLNVDRNDPNIRASADAYRASADRAGREHVNDMAESMGPGANILGEQRLTAERVGQQTGAFEAELMLREKTARRDEVAQALQLMAGRLTTDQTLALQKELAYLDAELRREGYDVSRYGMDLNFDMGLRDLAVQVAALSRP